MPNINKNIIMQAGAAVANATNKAAGLTAATPEPGAIISAIQLVNGGREIGPAALAHFTESVRNKLLSLLVHMEPIQDFNGYDHPWPAGGGKNKINLYDIASLGTNVTEIENGYSFTVASAQHDIGISFTPLTGQYTLSCKAKNGTATNFRLRLHYSDGTIKESDGTGTQTEFVELSVTSDTSKSVDGVRFNWSAAGSVEVVEFQLEQGTKTAYAPYSNICPISGRTGANAYVSPTPNVADAITYAADWTTPAGTVYAGSADIVTGDIKAAPYYASYNGETLVGPWVSSMDVYDPDGTPSTGAQVVDLGGTKTEYHITGQDIITLVGDNYIWSDSGDVTIIE